MPCIATYHRWAAFELLRPETAKGYNEQDTCPRVQSSSTRAKPTEEISSRANTETVSTIKVILFDTSIRGKFQSVGDEEQEEADEEDALVQALPDCSIEIPKCERHTLQRAHRFSCFFTTSITREDILACQSAF
uniref:Uncharacterized protein n=1 Tax=Trichogramma kaykai TaxID=54128 RepID=A0ABD2WD64_9HYME